VFDWGGAAVSPSIKENVYAVANEMKKTVEATNAQFVISTGDNFYWCGIETVNDFQFQTDFVDPYHELRLPWYNSLGNHEYAYNVSAQIEYSHVNEYWILPDRYYSKRLAVNEEQNVYMTIITLDTSPCISAYRSPNSSGWDPCSPSHPTCSFNDEDDDFEGPCDFHENILTQSCEDQYDWLAKTLEKVPTDDWLIIVGHHPVDEIDVLDFTSLLQNHNFDLYMNGHTHTLNQYTIDNAGHYITTGAGSLVSTDDQFTLITSKKAQGVKSIDSSSSYRPNSEYNYHTYETVWNMKVAGFTSHSFNLDYTQLTTNFVSYTGEVIHSFTVKK
jgi:predicted MPP superfamily phosphohydrolase